MSVLVVDVGTSGVRATVVRPDASIEHPHYREVLPETPMPGFVQFDAAAMAAAVLDVANAALESSGPVRAVGIANQRASTIVWDRATGEPVGPGVGWQDLRTVGTCLVLQGQGIRVAPNASATKLSFLLDEAASPAIGATIRGWVDQGERFAVPSLFWLEVVNVLGRVLGLAGKLVLESVFHLDDLDVTTVEPDRAQLILTIGRVERHGLTAYDASYLALAHSLSAPLATIDPRLADAAGAAWIDPAMSRRERRTSEVRARYENEGTWPEFRGASAYLAKLRAEGRQAAERTLRR